jgi:hypothetical protein
MSPPPARALDRRKALEALTLISVTAAGVAGAAPEVRAYRPGNDEDRARYRETEHVKAFYRTNGYETLKR